MEANTSKKVVGNSVIYIFCNMLIKCFGLFLLPLYTAHLTPADYGVTNIANHFISIMGFVGAFSLYSAIMRFYVDLKDDSQKLKRFYGTIISFCGISCVAFGLIFYLCRAVLEKYIFIGIPFYPVIFVTLISVFFSCQHTVYENILRSQQKAFKSSVLSIAYFLLTVALNIYFVVTLKLGAVGVLMATAISGGAYTAFFIVDMLIHKEMCFCIDLKLLKSALKYSIPIIPHNLSTHIATFVSSVLIGGTNTFAALGVYSVARQFGNVADGIQSSVNQAIAPWMYEKMHEGNSGEKKSIRNTINITCAIIGVFFLGIALFSHDYVVLFLDGEYSEAWIYIAAIVLMYAAKTIYYFFVNILFYNKKASNKVFVASLSNSLVNVLASAVLIPYIGAYGAILAELIGILVQIIIVIAMSRSFNDIGLRVRDFIGHVLMVCVFTVVGLLFTFTNYSTTFSLWDFLYRGLVLIVYIVINLFRYRSSIKGFIKVFIRRRSGT